MTDEKTSPRCPLYRKCGGCQMQNMSYKEQLSWKQKRVDILLSRFCRVSPIIGMENPLHYRNKVQAAFGFRRGQIISGVYQSGTHRIVPVDSCMIEDEKADAIIVSIRNLLKSFKITAYDEDSGTGLLRHVLVRRGFKSGQIMVVLVTSSPILPSSKNLVKALLSEHPEITTVVQNVNPYNTNLVLGPNEKPLYGAGYIEDTLCGCVFRISPSSFYQINPVQTEVLYGKAVGLAGLCCNETVIDAYCGIGTIGIVASKSAGNVIGIELNRDAVRDAVSNAKRNGVKNARFFCADAGEFMLEMAKDRQKADVVFMDPPRAGSDEKFLSSLVRLLPQRIVYISCNPETQERDMKYLTKNGYTAKAIQPVDMFPFTHHVETVVQLVRKKPDTYLDVKIDMSELDTTPAETAATYQEIKDYIQEKHGVKVSSLYIAIWRNVYEQTTACVKNLGISKQNAFQD